MQIRSYDKTQEKWLNHFVNSKRQRWTVTESRWIDGEMLTLNYRGYSNVERHMTQEIDVPPSTFLSVMHAAGLWRTMSNLGAAKYPNDSQPFFH